MDEDKLCVTTGAFANKAWKGVFLAKLAWKQPDADRCNEKPGNSQLEAARVSICEKLVSLR